jgi:uncharacterized membrane protein (UPF0127 family)
VKISNLTKQALLASDAEVADTLSTRTKGLLGRDNLSAGQALLIRRCNSIHTFFMRFAIDAVFADKNNQVVGLEHSMQPFGLSRIYWKASYVVELPAGTLKNTATSIGDTISLKN